MLILERPRRKQPLQHAEIHGPLARGLLHSLDGNLVLVNGRPYAGVLYSMASTTAVQLRAKSLGMGRDTTGTTNGNVHIIGDAPLAAADPWAFAFTHVPTANVSLSHAFGFGLLEKFDTSIDADGTRDGQYRSCLNFLSNYYFWGASADWDTGIPWDTDGAVHTVMFSHDGTNIYFWRDGVMRASAARPAGIVATPAGRKVTIGSRHPSATGAPSSTFLTGRVWGRFIPPGEASLYTRNPWCLYADRRYIPTATAAASAPTITALSAISITATSAQPQITYA